MRRRPQAPDRPAISFPVKGMLGSPQPIGLVLSGGGSRAAYQVGALRALVPFLSDQSQPISVVVGSSIGAVNGLMFSSCLKQGLTHAVDMLADCWVERTFRNTFAGSPSGAFFRAIRVAALQYMAPGPHASSQAIFDPSPLMRRVDGLIQEHGGLRPEDRLESLEAIGVMTTVEGSKRKPLLFLSTSKPLPDDALLGASFDVAFREELSAKHGFASAALPSILPPVELDAPHGKVRLVDGGISINVPVDPAVRLGAHRVLVIDISGRSWWLDRYNEPHDTRPTWEVPSGLETFCLRPPETLVLKNQKPFGPLLKDAVGSSTKRFIHAVGPTWPLFTLLKKKLGEDIAYEVMSYVALDKDYIQGLLEQGYGETQEKLKANQTLQFKHSDDFKQWAKNL